MTNKSHRSFASKSSQRLLFQDTAVEKREKKCHKQKKGDFLCTCPKSHAYEQYYHALEPYYWRPYQLIALEDESDEDSILGENDLVRSISAPAHETHDSEDKLMDPLPLERQLTNTMHYHKPSHSFGNPLEKIDVRHVVNIENNRNQDENRYKPVQRNFDTERLGTNDENIHYLN